MVDLVRERIDESLRVKHALLDGELPAQTAEAASVLVASLRTGGQALFFGNGGSAADATHLAAELVGRFSFDRAPVPALSLTDNASSMSAIANDFGYDETLARQIRAFGRPGDVAVGLSTSGMSPNVVRAFEAARAGGLRTIAFTGRSGGDCLAAVELCLRIPSDSTPRIQEASMLLAHTICELVERTLFGSS